MGTPFGIKDFKQLLVGNLFIDPLLCLKITSNVDSVLLFKLLNTKPNMQFNHGASK